MSVADRRRPRPVRRPVLPRALAGLVAFAALTPSALIAGSGALRPGSAVAPAGAPAVAPAAAPAVASAASPAALPRTTTDTIRARQWPLQTLHATRAWKLTRGDGITVAVLDTGVDGRHQDLTGQVIDGPDYTDGTRKPGSVYWGRHGTTVASIIAGHGHGPGAASGILGIAPQVRILSIRVTWENDDPARSGRGDLNRNSDAVSKGIRYAVDHGADVINMSLGGGRLDYYGNEIDEQAINYALRKGVVLIASMGNDGSTVNRRNFPAAYPGVIAVGAVDREFRPWKDSNRHEYVSLAAPGVEIVSADAGDRYVMGSGTSTSAAFAAGVASLVRSRYPQLTPEEVKQALQNGATHRPPTATGRDSRIGSGVVDAMGALKAAAKINKLAHAGTEPPRPAPAAAAPAPVAEQGGHSGRNLLLIMILAGGGLLVLVGLVMGWLQRHRPDEFDAGLDADADADEDGDGADDDADDDDDELAGYGALAGLGAEDERAAVPVVGGGASPPRHVAAGAGMRAASAHSQVNGHSRAGQASLPHDHAAPAHAVRASHAASDRPDALNGRQSPYSAYGPYDPPVPAAPAQPSVPVASVASASAYPSEPAEPLAPVQPPARVYPSTPAQPPAAEQTVPESQPLSEPLTLPLPELRPLPVPAPQSAAPKPDSTSAPAFQLINPPASTAEDVPPTPLPNGGGGERRDENEDYRPPWW